MSRWTQPHRLGKQGNVIPLRKPISEHGVLMFKCPRCDETLEVGLTPTPTWAVKHDSPTSACGPDRGEVLPNELVRATS